MKIRDILIRDIQEGKNWRFVPPENEEWVDLPIEEWGPIEEATEFLRTDHVVYSALTVYPDGRVEPIVCIREVLDLDFGGSYCEIVDGLWRQLGLRPKPAAGPSNTFIANPLTIDPSFDAPDHDYRAYHREGFLSHVVKL